MSSLNRMALRRSLSGRAALALLLLFATATPLHAQSERAAAEIAHLNAQVGAAFQTGRYQEVLGLAERASREALARLGKDHPITLASLSNLVVVYRRVGRTAEALPLNEKVLEKRRIVLGKDHIDTLMSQYSLAKLYEDLGREAEAETLLEQTAKKLERQAGPDHIFTLQCYEGLAAIRFKRGRAAAALPVAEDVAKRYQATLGENHHVTLVAKLSLATMYYYGPGRAKEALPLFEQTLTKLRSTLGEDHPRVVIGSATYADVLRDLGRFREAAALHEKILKYRQTNLGPDHPDTLSSREAIARLYYDEGNAAEAASRFEALLPKVRTIFGPNHPRTLTVLSHLAGAYRDQGRFAEAAALLEEALAKNRAIDPQSGDVTNNLGNLASLYRQQGRLAEAERLLEESIAISRRTKGENHRSTLTSRYSLAISYRAQGRLAEAQKTHEAVLAKRRAALGEDHPDTVQSLGALGTVYLARRKCLEAAPLLEKALSMRRGLVGEHHLDTIVNLANLASHRAACGRLAEARALFEQALKQLRAVAGNAHPLTLATLNNLALLYWRQGLFTEAVGALRESTTASRPWAELEADQTIDLKLRLDTLGRARTAGELVFGLAVAAPSSETAGLAADVVLDWKGLVGEREAELLRLVRGAGSDPAIATAAERLLMQRQQLAAAFFRSRREGVDEKTTDAAYKALQGARAGVDAAEADLTRQSLAYRQSRQARQLGTKELRAVIPADAALIEYVSYRTFDPDSAKWDPQRLLGAVVLRPDAAPVFVPLGPIDSIGQHVVALERLVGSGDAGFDSAEALYRLLVLPLQQHLQGAKTLYVSPDGVIARVPFEALVRSNGRRWIEDEVDLRYVPSGRALLRQPLVATATGMLAVGAVDFNAAPVVRSSDLTARANLPRPAITPLDSAPGAAVASSRGALVGLSTFRPLPGSLREAETIQEIWRKTTGGSARLITGKDANKMQLRQFAGSLRVLHLATHGFAVAWPDQKTDGGDRLALHSGIALTGANRAIAAGEGDDGVLSGFEIEMLPLDGTQLAVISACGTGLGVTDETEGIYGLARAFRISGVAAALVTLRPVDDQLAADFMEAFYRDWLSEPKRDPALALRMVKRVWAASDDHLRSDPSTWAAFVLVQNTR